MRSTLADNSGVCAASIGTFNACAANPKTLPDVPASIHSLNAVTERLQCATKGLSERLRSVLRPVPANGSAEVGKDSSIYCDVAAQVHSRVDALNQLAEAIEYLAQEVQL